MSPAGTVKKCALLKIVHEKYRVATSSRKMTEAEVSEFHQDMQDAAAANRDLAPFVGKAQEILNPLRVLHLFESIPAEVQGGQWGGRREALSYLVLGWISYMK